MELWIRSQTKIILQKVDNLLISDGDNAKGTFNIYTNSLPVQNVLGEYETKERALEILDEIQNKINLINLGHDFGSPMIDLKNPTYIYQMPEN